MKVKAKRLGFYDDERRREGAVFFLKEPEHFSDSWMVKAEQGEQVDPAAHRRSKQKASVLKKSSESETKKSRIDKNVI